MTSPDDLASIGRVLDAFAARYHCVSVAADDPDDAGVPPDMRDGPVDDDGWVRWRVLPSTLSEDDLADLERDVGDVFPPLFRAYLLARFHLFDQVRSARYQQLILMTDVPSGRRLGGLRALVRAWQPLVGAGYLPFAQWGDGWGPMSFDLHRRDDRGECPIVWMDHERLIPLGASMRRREAVAPWAQPLYGSFRELVSDVFGAGG